MGLSAEVDADDADVEPIPAPGPLPWDATVADGWNEPTSRIRLVVEIGRGSMGTVYRGRDDWLGRDVAVKLLREGRERDPALRRRFLAEARVAGQFQHPGIVPVYELGLLEGDRPYIAMKLVEGRTLAELLVERPDPSHDRGRFLAIFVLACHAVAYAHSRGVIHRDLKPANIMVGPFGEVQVMDWGLAKILDGGPSHIDWSGDVGNRTRGPNESQAGTVVGTPAYMSPEQAAGDLRNVDERSDVFGLGAILYETLTGRPPFPSAGSAEGVSASHQRELAEPRSLLPGIPRDLEIICLKCLESDPDRRYSRASELADDLDRFLEGRAIAARPVGPLGLIARWCRRNKALAAAIALASVSLVTLAIGGAASAIVQADLRHKAEIEADRARKSEALAGMQRDHAQKQFDTLMADIRSLSNVTEGDSATQRRRLNELWINSLRAYLTRADLGDEPPIEVLTMQYNIARALDDYGTLEESRQWYSRVLELGKAMRAAGKFAPAESILVARHLVNAYVGLGVGFAKEDKIDTAIEIWRAGREIARAEHDRFPKDSNLWNGRYALLGNLAFALKEKGNLDESAEVTRERETVDANPPGPE
jgi:tRNA A-37 threonylcarbamoyl transferase component Bud32/tetratricopeptide (TPR) repeat protein